MSGSRTDDSGSGSAVKTWRFKGFDCGPIKDLTTFDMRNGGPADARSLLVKPTIPRSFHWQFIFGLPCTMAFRFVDAHILACYAQLTTTSSVVPDQAKARKIAVVLGTARAVTTELYKIEEADVIPGERASSMLQAVKDPDGTYAIEMHPNCPPDAKAIIEAELVLSDTERAAVVSAHMSAIGVLPLQGYSLHMTGHHYLGEGDNQSRRAFAVVEKQNWQGMAVKEWWDANEKDLRDALWHKSCHPIVLSLKRHVAQSEDVPEMLRTAGAGAAAARLPAVESELRMAGSYVTLLKTVRPLFEFYGGALDFEVLLMAISYVHVFPPMGRTSSTSTKPDVPASLPPHVKDRKTALANLKDVCDRNSDITALAYGFYCALSEQSALAGTTGGTDTLKTSFSLKRLKTQSYASWVTGNQAYGDFAAARNQARMAGKYEPPKFTFA